VAGSVLMEGGHEDALTEARWLSDLADADPGSARTAVVARVQLEAPDAPQQLAALAELPRVHGVRQILNVAGPDTPRPAYAATRPDLITDPAWRLGLAAVAEAGLTFDLQAQPHQLPLLAALAADFGGISFVLDHGGYMTPRTPETDEAWRTGIRVLAREPNVVVKASDYSTVNPALTGLDNFVQELLEAFGPDRVLFASNFPGERQAQSYPGLVARFGAALRALDPAEKASVWSANATRIYRLGPPEPTQYDPPGRKPCST
jgi:predicted TIM-barrel fold metal-dependent hydrolase